jgi:hypothetical protein
MSGQQPEKNNGLDERKAEATEKETLKDLEEAFGSSNAEEKDDNDVPSPDGAFDEESELEKADPK